MGDWFSFCQSLRSSSWLTLGLTLGGGFVTVVNVHPTWPRTSPRGVEPVGLGAGVGDCCDAAVLQKEGLFISLLVFSREENYALFTGVWFIIFVYC